MGVQIINFATFKAATGGGGYDTDAQAFFTATGITDTTIKDAIDAFVVGLKADSLWTKMTAIYPFVGGTSTTHSYNLKATGSFQITWGGTVTHNSNGITGNGLTGYGDTGINPSTHTTLNDLHLSIYCRTASIDDAKAEWGCYDSGGSNQFQMLIRNGSGNFTGLFYSSSSGAPSVANTNAQGFYVFSRRSSTDAELYKNGSSVATNTSSNGGSRPNRTVYIAADNGSFGVDSFSNRNYSFASLGTSLSDTDAANLNTRVETLQDALSRGVV